MKSIISKTIALVTVSALLFSFSSKFGGEGFEISLNGKLLLQQFGNSMDNVKNLELDKISASDRLTIKYHHCGRVGKNRIVSIKDEKNNLIKEWHFADTNEPVAAMNCDMKDILSLKKTKGNSFKLYYSSTELPKGRLLTNIVLGNSSVAKK
jgi:hypothetical protein